MDEDADAGGVQRAGHVLVLLDVEDEVEAVEGPRVLRHQRRPSVPVERVAHPLVRDLRLEMGMIRSSLWKIGGFGIDALTR